jgi:F0F1-type ATP synthase assembly protein I
MAAEDSNRPDGLDIPETLRGPTLRPTKPPDPDAGMWGMAKAWGIALDFIFTIVAGAGLGWAADRYWTKSPPTGLMIGLALGFVVAFIRIVRGTIKQDREETARKRDQNSRR